MAMLNFFLLVAILAIVASAERVSYRGHRVQRCVPTSMDQVTKLRNSDLDFWAEPRAVGTFVDVASRPGNHEVVTEFLSNLGLSCNIMIPDVEELMENERKTVANKDTSFLENYHEWQDVYSYFDSLAASYPNLASNTVIGKTYFGKDIKVMQISTNPAAKKPALWFDGGLHARYVTTKHI
jgi:hypothetical protein